jgi:hypothetical protein
VRRRNAPARDRREPERRVGHHVADDLGSAGCAFGAERLDRSLVRAEKERSQAVYLDPRALLGHRQIAASQPGLDVGDRPPRSGRGACTGEGRVGVAENEDEVRPLGVDHLLNRRSEGLDVGRPEVEPVGRLRELELVEEDRGELVVPMLSGVDDDLLDVGGPERLGKRRRLDELWPVADDSDDLHEGGS